jgi:hypothetical protein
MTLVRYALRACCRVKCDLARLQYSTACASSACMHRQRTFQRSLIYLTQHATECHTTHCMVHSPGMGSRPLTATNPNPNPNPNPKVHNTSMDGRPLTVRMATLRGTGKVGTVDDAFADVDPLMAVRASHPQLVSNFYPHPISKWFRGFISKPASSAATTPFRWLIPSLSCTRCSI